QTTADALAAPRAPDADLVEQKLARRLLPHPEDVAEHEAHDFLPGKRDPGQEVRIGEERRCRPRRERRLDATLPLQVELLILLREKREDVLIPWPELADVDRRPGTCPLHGSERDVVLGRAGRLVQLVHLPRWGTQGVRDGGPRPAGSCAFCPTPPPP